MRYYLCDQYPIEFVVSENIDQYFDSHTHVGHYVVSVVLQGMVVVRLGNRQMTCHRNDVFVVPPYVVHSVRQGKDVCLLSMCIGTALIEKTDLRNTEEVVRRLLGGAAVQGMIGRTQGERLLASVRTVYGQQDHVRKELDADIKSLADQLTSHPEQELSIETLAANIFISKYYLIRKFKNSIGMTPHQFCIQNRIRKSQGMLDKGRTISGIATEMGFYDQSHFDKAFQKIVGISPSAYIRSKRRIGQGT